MKNNPKTKKAKRNKVRIKEHIKKNPESTTPVETSDTNAKYTIDEDIISIEAQSNLEQLNISIKPVDDSPLISVAQSIGYESMGYGTTYEDETEGLLIQMNDENNKYNNGIYMLHQLLDGALVMEVIVPNSKDKGNLIQQFIDTVTTAIDGFDTSDMTTFDYAEAFGYIIAKSNVKDLARSLFPDDKEKQTRFVLLYLPRFLATTAYLYTGADHIMEESVNSEPYVLKMKIEQATMEGMKQKQEQESETASKEPKGQDGDTSDKQENL